MGGVFGPEGHHDPIPTPVFFESLPPMIASLLILAAVILQGLGSWGALAGLVAFSLRLDPVMIGLPNVVGAARLRLLWAALIVIGLALLLAGSALAAWVLGAV